jgi:hypothetical protein
MNNITSESKNSDLAQSNRSLSGSKKDPRNEIFVRSELDESLLNQLMEKYPTVDKNEIKDLIHLEGTGLDNSEYALVKHRVDFQLKKKFGVNNSSSSLDYNPLKESVQKKRNSSKKDDYLLKIKMDLKNLHAMDSEKTSSGSLVSPIANKVRERNHSTTSAVSSHNSSHQDSFRESSGTSEAEKYGNKKFGILYYTVHHKAPNHGRCENSSVVVEDMNFYGQPNEAPLTSLYAVFDGHGGPNVSFYVAQHIGSIIFNQSTFKTDLISAIEQSFLQMDNLIFDKLSRDVNPTHLF